MPALLVKPPPAQAGTDCREWRVKPRPQSMIPKGRRLPDLTHVERSCRGAGELTGGHSMLDRPDTRAIASLTEPSQPHDESIAEPTAQKEGGHAIRAQPIRPSGLRVKDMMRSSSDD